MFPTIWTSGGASGGAFATLDFGNRPNYMHVFIILLFKNKWL